MSAPLPTVAQEGVLGLRLGLLGHLTVTIDGEPRLLRYGKAKALLGYLAMQNRPVVRSTIAVQLWESLPTDRAKANLRVVLNDLRGCLGPYLAVNRDTVALDRSRLITTDVEELQSAFAGGVTSITDRRSIEVLAGAVGEFLEGVEVADAPEIDAFIQSQRTRLQRLTTDAIIAALGPSGDPDAPRRDAVDDDLVAGLVHRLGMLEPWNEEGRRVVLRAYDRMGRPATALAIFEEFRDALLAGFGLSPEAETVALAEQISERSGIAVNSPVSSRKLLRPATPLFGREAELAAIERAFADGRLLVTVTGPGGIGKSRLALEVAWRAVESPGPRSPVSAVVVDLADITDGTDLATAAANAMGVPFAGFRSPLVELLSILRDRHILLVLDNGARAIDHVGRFVDAVLAACPEVRVLLTSRVPLRARTEVVIPVPALPVPEPDDPEEAVAANPSFRLVAARADALGTPLQPADLPAVAELCRQVGGLPLALELVTTRLRLITPHELVASLPGALEGVADDASDRPSRHRTLRRSIRWSYDLLTDDAQQAFRLLGVFRGGAPIGAVAGMIPADEGGWRAVVRVVDAWLAQRTDGPGGTRLAMSEPIRAFAQELLASSGELADVAGRHAEVFLDFADQAAVSLRGSEQGTWLERLEVEHENLRGALDHLVETGDAAGALRMVNALSGFWLLRGLGDEARHWFDLATGLAADDGSEGLGPLRALAHARAAMLAVHTHRSDEVAEHLGLARGALGDTLDPVIDAELVHVEVYAALRFERSPDGAALADRLDPAIVTAERNGEQWEAALYRHTQSWLALADGDFDNARRLARVSREGFEAEGDRRCSTLTVVVTAMADGLQGRTREAIAELYGAFRTLRALGDLSACMYAMACASGGIALLGDDRSAARLFGAFAAGVARTGLVLPEISAELLDEFQALVRSRLGPEAWEAAWEAGREAGFDVDWGPLA